MATAYFLTFTTYGTWRHGSEKGSVDRHHNSFGAPLIEPNKERDQMSSAMMTQTAYEMGPAEREVVCQAIIEISKNRLWELLAEHVRTNHVHVVIVANREPARLLSDLKAYASRLLTVAGFGTRDLKRWTRHGSTRYLFRDADIESAVRYTIEEQGEPMAWYLKE